MVSFSLFTRFTLQSVFLPVWYSAKVVRRYLVMSLQKGWTRFDVGKITISMSKRIGSRLQRGRRLCSVYTEWAFYRAFYMSGLPPMRYLWLTSPGLSEWIFQRQRVPGSKIPFFFLFLSPVDFYKDENQKRALLGSKNFRREFPHLHINQQYLMVPFNSTVQKIWWSMVIAIFLLYLCQNFDLSRIAETGSVLSGELPRQLEHTSLASKLITSLSYKNNY